MTGLPHDVEVARLVIIYDQYRSSRFNQLYYGSRLASCRRWNLGAEIALIIGTSGTIGAWAVFKTGLGAYAWGAIAGLASLVAILQPVVKLKDKVEHYSMLYTGHSTAFNDLRNLVNDIRAEQTLTPEMWSKFQSATDRFTTLNLADDPRISGTLRGRCYREVNREIPPESLWIPESSTNADE